MKFVCFHLMPYRPLDFEAAKNYRSAWVVLPNSFYDPVKGAAEYVPISTSLLTPKSSASTPSTSTNIIRPRTG